MIRSINPTAFSATMSYGALTCMDGVNAKYYVKASNLAWKTTDWLGVGSLTNALTTPIYVYKIGRINVTHWDGTVYQAIGRVVGGTMYYYKEGGTAEAFSTGPYDVLVCN